MLSHTTPDISLVPAKQNLKITQDHNFYVLFMLIATKTNKSLPTERFAYVKNRNLSNCKTHISGLKKIYDVS